MYNTPLGEQFVSIINRRMPTVNETVGTYTAEEIASRMKDNSQEGHGFANDEYFPTYERKYARRRAKMGLQTEVVELRAKKKRIEYTQVSRPKQDTTKITFQDSEWGRIARYHHTGIQYSRVGFRQRSIFPQEVGSIPQDLRDEVYKQTGMILNGAK